MPLDRQIVRRLLEAGAQAPSGDNLQPWIAAIEGDTIHLSIDTAKDRSLYNFQNRASLIALGAMIENITIAGGALGASVEVELSPAPAGLVSARLRLGPAVVRPDPLFEAIQKRCSNRKGYGREPLRPDVATALVGAVSRETGAEFHLVQDRAAMRTIARAASLNDRVLFELRELHDRFFESVRWTAEEAERTRDGLYVKTLELGPIGPSFRAARSWGFLRAANLVGASRTAPIHSHQTFLRSAAFVYVQMPETSPMACVLGGRAVQRVWLTATSLGLSAQPMAGMLCLLPYLDHPEVPGVDDSARALIGRAREMLRTALPMVAGRLPVLLLRIGFSAAPSAVSMRQEIRF